MRRFDANVLEKRINELEREKIELSNNLSELQRQLSWYQSLFLNMLHEVHFWELVRDESGKIKTWRLLDANPKALKSWGVTLSQVVGRTAEDIFDDPTVPDLFMPIVEKIFSENKPYRWEQFFKPTNQTLEMISIPVGDYFISTGLDITERKKTEQSLRESEEKFRLLLNSTAEAIYGVDISGNCIFCNPACVKTLGYSREADLLGRNMHELIHHHRNDGTEYPEKECKIYMAFRRGEGVHVEDEIFWRKDGNYFDAKYSSFPIYKKKALVGAVVTFHDITERKKNHADLMEAKRLAEEANAFKSDFLATISHEIRTPMTVFMSAIEHLLEIEKNTEYRKILDLASVSSKRLYTLLNEVLDHSKIESHQMKLEENVFNLRECLIEIVDMMKDRAHKKGLILKLEVSSSVPEEKSGDPYRLGQILLNLIGNAIKFTDKGEVLVKVERNNNEIIFSVHDTGVGIPEDKFDEIFESFRQMDSSSTRRYGGVGLGLAISKGLTELMGGHIYVNSEPGKGSVFCFALPIQNEHPNNKCPVFEK